jgi:fatty-acyl-CoA synthase
MEVPLLVNDFLRRAVKLYAEKEAVVCGAERFTYKQYGARVNQLSHALLAMGVNKGDRVAILSPNCHRFLESFYGTSQIGAILVPINYRLVVSDFEYIVNHSGSSVFLVDRELVSVADGLRPALPTVKHYLVSQAAGEAVPRGWQSWEAQLRAQPVAPPPQPPLDENDLVSINYTSGTTARPKGVMLTHRNFYLNTLNFLAMLRIQHDDVEMWTLPMFHCNGWGGPYALTAMGAKHVVLRMARADEIYRLVEAEGVTFACMAPAVLSAILNYPDKAKHKIRTRPRFTVAGAPPPAAFIKRLEVELGWEFMQIYGLTETSPILTFAHVKPYKNHQGDDYYQVKSKAGSEAIGVELRVVNEDGKEVACDGQQIGEIVARSNVVFKGYWDQPEETAKAIVDGWFHTGDLATVDPDGYIHIVDRAKDIIISGGENISTIEIENALYKHPAVLECAVVGVPSERWGETPKALIIRRDGAQATEDELIAFCRERLAHFKSPTSVEFVESLPRTATGKLQKYLIREKYWKGYDRRVH